MPATPRARPRNCAGNIWRRRMSWSSSRPTASSRASRNISRRSRCICRVATSDSGKLISAALSGLRAIWRAGYRYKKAGVLLLDLHPASAVQESLFDKRDDARRTALMRTIDAINRQHGRDTVSFAAAGITAAVEDAARTAVAVLHDGLGWVAAGVRSLCCGLLN